MQSSSNHFDMPQRPLAKSGELISAMGFGGYHLGVIKDDAEAIKLTQAAIDNGITFMDNAWEYHSGRSEELMGNAIHDRRDKVFLMTKVCTHGRGREEAMRQLEDSLRRLQTDHLDCWQIHEVVYDNDPEWHFKADGVIEAMAQAKQQGKVRYIGFTGHKSPAVHLKMLNYNYPFDTCQLPLNCLDGTYRSFEASVLPELIKQNISPLAMKSLNGSGAIVKNGIAAPEEAIRYVLSLPVTTLICGMLTMDDLQQNLKIIRNFQPMSEEDRRALRERVANVAGDGRFELYKSTAKHDGEIGRAQHGFPTFAEVRS